MLLARCICKFHSMDPRDNQIAVTINRARNMGLNEGQVRRLLGAVVGRADYSPSNWARLAIMSKEASKGFGPLPTLKIERILKSESDGFKKVVFKTDDDLSVETVIIPLRKANMSTVCLSSQVGCVMGCKFCATGRMSRRRNLATWEIVDQFIQARSIVERENCKVSGAVFMGMGEPFLNYSNVISAAQILSYPVYNAISAKAITISTVGVLEKIDRFIYENLPYRLSISLSAACDRKRAQIMPIAARTPVSSLIESARRYAYKRNTRVMLAYVCISEFNVGVDDARLLGDLIGNTPVRLDLIDVNDTTGKFRPPSSEELNIFRDALTKYVGQPVARRYSGGFDIRAACGTLAGE